jgi:hypothetical protein
MNEDEIQAKIDAATNVDLTPEEPKIEAEPVVEPVVEPETSEVTPEIAPEPEVTPEEEEEDDRTVSIKRYADSTREAQVIAHSKKELEEEIDEAQNIPLPSIDELKAENPDWDLMSATEQKLATKLMHLEKKEAKVLEIRNKAKADEAKIVQRAKEIEAFTIDPTILKKFPKLEGKEEEFKLFATKQTRLSLDLEDAAGLFSIQLPEPVKHKGQMFETGTGGASDKQKPKDDKISLEEAALLMKTDYNKYKEMLIAGKVKLDV